MQAICDISAENDGSAPPTCPVCGSLENVEWGMRTSCIIFECQTCGVVFFDRTKFGPHDYQTYYEYTDTWDASRVQWELKIRRRALTKQLARIGQYVDGRRLLDIGAGPGYLCHIATTEGWKAQGVEPSKKAVRIGQEFLNVEYLDLEHSVDASFDVITCYHVLEHMQRPDEFIRKLDSKLKPKGVLAIHVPHREPLSFSIRNRLNSWKGASAEKLCQLYVPEHISGFTSDSLAKTLGIFGFQSLFCETSAMWGTYYDPFFLKNYLRAKDYSGIVKQTLRSLVENAGVVFDRGDWVVGHFRKN